MHPDVDSRDGQKRVEACGNALPPHHQTPVFLLEPGKCPLGLEPWNRFFDRPATVFLGLPDALRDLRPDPTLPQLLPQRFRVIPFICRDDPESFARTASFAGAHLHSIE